MPVIFTIILPYLRHFFTWLTIAWCLGIGAGSLSAQTVAPNPTLATDSLLKLVNETADNRQKAVLYNQVALTLRFRAPSKSIVYAEQALNLARKYSYQLESAEAYHTLGLLSFDSRQYTQSLDNYAKALKAYSVNQKTASVAQVFIDIGNIYNALEDHAKALSYYFESLKLAEKNEFGLIRAKVLTQIGNVYLVLKDYKEAETYFAKGLQQSNQLAYLEGQAMNLNQLGELCSRQQRAAEALQYYTQALAVQEKIGNTLIIAETYLGIGNSYLKQTDYTRALANYSKALALFEEQKDFKGVSRIQTQIGVLYQQNKDPDRAIEYFEKSIATAQQADFKEQLQHNYTLLSAAFEANGNTDQALQTLKQANLLYDSLYSEKKLSIIGEMKARYDLESKEKIIESLRFQKDKSDAALAQEQNNLKWQKWTSFWIGFSACLAVGAALLIYRNLSKMKKLNQTLHSNNKKIAEQKEEIEFKSNQLQKTNKKITDSLRYAKAIQDSLLPTPHKIRQLCPDYFIIYKAKDLVSGDFYWLDKVDNKLFVVVADCKGHGLSGGLLSTIGNALLNEILNQHRIFTPSLILERMHEALLEIAGKEHKQIELSMQIGLCVVEPSEYDPDKMILTFAGAGRPLYYIQHAEMTELKGDRFSIGEVNEKKVFSNRCLEVQRGGILYMNTDGYIDQANPEQRRFGTQNFKNALQSGIAEKSLEEQQEYFEKLLQEHQKSAPQRDDITLLAIML